MHGLILRMTRRGPAINAGREPLSSASCHWLITDSGGVAILYGVELYNQRVPGGDAADKVQIAHHGIRQHHIARHAADGRIGQQTDPVVNCG